MRNDYYEISNYGNIRVKKTKKILKPFISNSGYYRVGLTLNNNKRKNFSIHVLTAYMFCEKMSVDQVQVNHLDGDKFHNYYKNIKWSTISENNQHAYDTGLMKKGKEHHLGKFTDEFVHRICQHLENGDDIYTIVSSLLNEPNIDRSSIKYQKLRVYIKKIRQRNFRKDIVEQYNF